MGAFEEIRSSITITWRKNIIIWAFEHLTWPCYWCSEHLSIWTFQHLNILLDLVVVAFEHLSIWTFEHFNIWTFDLALLLLHLNIWAFELLNISTFERLTWPCCCCIWHFEHFNIWTFDLALLLLHLNGPSARVTEVNMGVGQQVQHHSTSLQKCCFLDFPVLLFAFW